MKALRSVTIIVGGTTLILAFFGIFFLGYSAMFPIFAQRIGYPVTEYPVMITIGGWVGMVNFLLCNVIANMFARWVLSKL